MTELLTVLLMVVFLGLSAFFSGSETALFSLGKLARRRLERSGLRGERLAASLLSRPRKTLITILIGNMFVNIGASAVATSMAMSLTASWGQGYGVAVAVSVMTVLLLIFGEVTPKAIAVQHPETFARIVSRPLHLFGRIIAWLAAALTWITDHAVNLLAPSTGEREPLVTFDELSTLIRLGERHGQIKPREKELIDYIFEFQETMVREIMTPRHAIQAVDMALDDEAFRHEVRRHRRSCLLAYRDELDSIEGILQCKPFLLAEDERPTRHLQRPYFVPETKRASAMLTDFRERQIEFAVVLDEHGDVVGVITLEDLLEELFGEVYDEDEVEERLILPKEKGWRVLGQCPLDDLAEVLQIPLEAEAEGVDTVAGFVMDHFGRIPHVGQRFVQAGWQFVVLRATKRRIYEIEVHSSAPGDGKKGDGR